jgi:transaldolase
VKLFLDSAEPVEIAKNTRFVVGFTANASMIAAAAKGMRWSYREQCKFILEATDGKSTSLQVTADTRDEILAQAHRLADLAPNVVVKVPVMDTKGNSLAAVAQQLEAEGVRVNVTAIFAPEQAVSGVTINSVFCGRLSYTGRDPVEVFLAVKARTDAEVLWAGVRGPYNIYEAERSGADIVTTPADSLDRYLKNTSRGLLAFSQQTVQEFHRDGSAIEW